MHFISTTLTSIEKEKKKSQIFLSNNVTINVFQQNVRGMDPARFYTCI